MPKKPDERIEPAKKMYLEGMKLIDIAKQLDLPEGTVRRWKSTHKWDSERSDKDEANVRKRKRGGQPGNHNATGPPRNRHAEKHGFFTKWLPEETMEILDHTKDDDPLDLLWDNIQLQYAAIIRGQKLMYVKDQDDKTIEKIEEKDNGNIIGERWEVQQAWDKHATFLGAQSKAIGTLVKMIKEYDELLHKNWDTASEIQKAQLDQIKAQTDKLKSDSEKLDAEAQVVIHDDIPKPEQN